MSTTDNAEREAMRSLAEADRELASTRIGAPNGAQMEAVASLGRVALGPLPVASSAAWLKLSDLFRMGTNLHRWCVLRALSQRPHRSFPGNACATSAAGGQQPAAVLSHAEVARRVHVVLLSNDPVARSLALRLLASMPHLLRDKLMVHHRHVYTVRKCLGSKFASERESAAIAADSLCAASPVFAESVIARLPTMIRVARDASSSRPRAALRLVGVLRHMHHTASLTSRAHAVCEQPVHIVVAAARAATALSRRSLVDARAQSEFLETLVRDDPRAAVRSASLRCLASLCRASPHTAVNAGLLLEAAGSRQQPDAVRGAALEALASLARELLLVLAT
eukprot:m51a1_g8636 hypothetical protein (338) ;mRNA; r:163892-165315